MCLPPSLPIRSVQIFPEGFPIVVPSPVFASILNPNKNAKLTPDNDFKENEEVKKSYHLFSLPAKSIPASHLRLSINNLKVLFDLLSMLVYTASEVII